MRACYPAAAVLAVLGFLNAAPTAAAEPCPKNCPSGQVPLGIAAPLSGSMTAFGRAAIKATDLAIKEVNDAGGVLGIPVVPVTADDRCDAGRAPAVAQKHIEERVGFVIGPACPAVAMDATPFYAKAGIVQTRRRPRRSPLTLRASMPAKKSRSYSANSSTGAPSPR
jgi:branched-chain amino acid transport system substrate-binding protein